VVAPQPSLRFRFSPLPPPPSPRFIFFCTTIVFISWPTVFSFSSLPSELTKVVGLVLQPCEIEFRSSPSPPPSALHFPPPRLFRLITFLLLRCPIQPRHTKWGLEWTAEFNSLLSRKDLCTKIHVGFLVNLPLFLGRGAAIKELLPFLPSLPTTKLR